MARPHLKISLAINGSSLGAKCSMESLMDSYAAFPNKVEFTKASGEMVIKTDGAVKFSAMEVTHSVFGKMVICMETAGNLACLQGTKKKDSSSTISLSAHSKETKRTISTGI